jgi:hypothetical protein
MRGLTERYGPQADQIGAQRHGGVERWRAHLGSAQGQNERRAIMEGLLTTDPAGWQRFAVAARSVSETAGRYYSQAGPGCYRVTGGLDGWW